MRKDTQELEVEEVPFDGGQIAFRPVLPAAPGTKAETGTRVAADEDIGFGKGADITHVPDMEIDVGEDGTIGGTGNGIDIVGP